MKRGLKRDTSLLNLQRMKKSPDLEVSSTVRWTTAVTVGHSQLSATGSPHCLGRAADSETPLVSSCVSQTPTGTEDLGMKAQLKGSPGSLHLPACPCLCSVAKRLQSTLHRTVCTQRNGDSFYS